MAPFGIKKYLKALIRRLKVGHIYSTVHNYPRTTSEVVDNIISTVNVFKKQCTDSKVSQSLITDSEAPQSLQIDL
jgi:hypothetical protein